MVFEVKLFQRHVNRENRKHTKEKKNVNPLRFPCSPCSTQVQENLVGLEGTALELIEISCYFFFVDKHDYIVK